MSSAHPFDLDNAAGYAAWREQKLATAPRQLADIVVEINDPRALTAAERARLIECNAVANMVVYVGKTGTDPDKEIPRRLGAQLGLHRLDSHWLTDDDAISPISVRGAEERGERKEFIPYTDKPIRWHTDGYYNSPERTVRGLLLHCVQSAAGGGDNQLLDHEIAYLLLRDENPEHICALSAPDAMTIPPRCDDNGIACAAQPGPVFSVDAAGFLHMRYGAHRQHRMEERRRHRGGRGRPGAPARHADAVDPARTPRTRHGPGVEQRAARPQRLHRRSRPPALLYRAYRVRYYERVGNGTV